MTLKGIFLKFTLKPLRVEASHFAYTLKRIIG